MAQTFVDILDANGAHQKMDVFSVPSAQLRETTVIGSPTVDAAVLELFTADPGATAYGLPVRPLRDGVLTHHFVPLSSGNNATVVKNSAASLKAVHLQNQTDGWIFFKTFNKATTPVPGSDTVKNTFGVQAGTRLDITFAEGGIPFSAGLAYATLLGATDGDNTAIAAFGMLVDLEYK